MITKRVTVIGATGAAGRAYIRALKAAGPAPLAEALGVRLADVATFLRSLGWATAKAGADPSDRMPEA